MTAAIDAVLTRGSAEGPVPPFRITYHYLVGNNNPDLSKLAYDYETALIWRDFFAARGELAGIYQRTVITGDWAATEI